MIDKLKDFLFLVALIAAWVGAVLIMTWILTGWKWWA